MKLENIFTGTPKDFPIDTGKMVFQACEIAMQFHKASKMVAMVFEDFPEYRTAAAMDYMGNHVIYYPFFYPHGADRLLTGVILVKVSAERYMLLFKINNTVYYVKQELDDERLIQILVRPYPAEWLNSILAKLIKMQNLDLDSIRKITVKDEDFDFKYKSTTHEEFEESLKVVKQTSKLVN